jgi:hypothetical protein
MPPPLCVLDTFLPIELIALFIFPLLKIVHFCYRNKSQYEKSTVCWYHLYLRMSVVEPKLKKAPSSRVPKLIAMISQFAPTGLTLVVKAGAA